MIGLTSSLEFLDPPIKRFAQRHTYLSTDAIASRDLGASMARQTKATGSSGGTPTPLSRGDTQLSLLSPPTQPPPPTTSTKRPPSPEPRKREEPSRSATDHGPPPKRPRPLSPVRGDRDRDRWDGPPRRRFGSPPLAPWERDRDRDAPPPRRPERDREDEKPVTLPAVISWFVGQLPGSSVFDGELTPYSCRIAAHLDCGSGIGPVFRTDDLMMLFRNAVIPSTNVARVRSPPPSAPARSKSATLLSIIHRVDPKDIGGRPPPDYGPYQGPGGGRGGRRY